MSRLRLNWQLYSTDERKNFVDTYLPTLPNPTPEELETIANYILYGKDSDDRNCVQRGEIEIETRKKTWVKEEIQSLDALIESPTFNES